MAIGTIKKSIFTDIANAIRVQNGLSETYRPPEMAAAILTLTWDVGVKIRALLLSDGTLEFNYRDGRSSDVPGATILRAWEVDPAGYASAGARPWDGDKLAVTRAVFDSDLSRSGLASTAYFFHGCANLVEAEGFDALSGVTDMTQMFVSCESLETIWADGFASSVASGSLMFSGCTRLVGGRGYVPASMAAYGEVNLNYWFYGHQALKEVAGMGNLAGVRQMRHTFNSCAALASLDLSGMDPSALEDLTYTFSGCKSLATIWADAGWALPAGLSGSQTFRQCASLVGGAGTAWSSSAVAGTYMRIDGGAAAPGYLTVKAGS